MWYNYEKILNSKEHEMSEPSGNPPAMITISRSEYEQLVDDSEFLAHLQANGVDNWEGYARPYNYDEDDDYLIFNNNDYGRLDDIDEEDEDNDEEIPF